MTKFTHQAPVVRVLKEKHPEADKLSLVYLFDRSVQLVVNSDSWQDGELAIYLQPQSLVDCWKEPFTFLNKGDCEQWVRVKAIKLRNYVSNGCLAKIPSDLSVSEGDDVAATLDIRHWEPELESLTTGGQTVKGENLSKYDIEDVLTGEDEYENGYIGEETVTLHRCKDGKWYIEPGTSFHAGQ